MNGHKHVRRAHKHQRGVGLIEVLLAVVLMSIGFLAAGRMQIEGMSASQNAYALSQAKYMVLDMTERMRSNREALANGLYGNLKTAKGTDAPGCVAAGTLCSPNQRVQADLNAWSELLHPSNGATPLLPSIADIQASGTVTLVDGTYRVTATWPERSREAQSGHVARSYSVRVVP